MAKTNTEDRDEVLYNFHMAYPSPTAADIINWIGRFPQYADDIRAHAAIARDWAAQAETEVEADDLEIQRAYSRALNIIYHSADADGEANAVGFFELLARGGTKISKIAAEIDIARSVLADLFNGWMLPPVGGKLARAVRNALGIDQATFDRKLAFALAHPRMGEAKASGPPQVLQRSYRDSIESSGMSPERIRFWLEEE